ncbi:HAD hydrolase family protein [Paenibacillus woosongensis]|uniref:HAD hydrolase family protein n=1 Tax=Paenibacillus woosongensis TaxID=307580 RepID=UPI003D315AF7
MSRIFITDLDGTLLRSDQTMSDFTVDVLNSAIQEGCIISFATARGLISAYSVVSDIAWKHPVILYNGALLFDVIHNRVIDGYFLDAGLTNEIIQRGKKHGCTPFYFLLDPSNKERVYHEKLTSFGMTEFLKSRINDPRFIEVNTLESSDHEKTLALTFIGELDDLLPLKEEVSSVLGDKVNHHIMKDYYIENQYFLEFSHPLAAKCEGLKMWARHMNVETKDICIFGDNLNDLGLFEVGGKKIAVANSHADILRIADTVIESNNEDGVAKFIKTCIK